ncbi:MAG: A/G-specific adenine glycosylase [Candidatus Eisenbacteria bacterium]|nr:A/G-specific adenine glycosylase [Candidatus Eisenbacteria bacterium]
MMPSDTKSAGERPAPIPAAAFRRKLLRWYDRSRRDLPWRGAKDPYRILVSEVMLQQTRVEVVRDRYGRFLQRFPDMRTLASASEDDVLAEWSGLGYYRRASNLRAAARAIVEKHGGRFPSSESDAAALPGVGPYTVSAVLSIAYDLPSAAVDGNVSRVLSRLALLPARPPHHVRREADRLLSRERPGDANQALMDLGATICVPRGPRCADCPLRDMCGAFRSRRTDNFPPAEKGTDTVDEAATLWIAHRPGDAIWLERRRQRPLVGMWMLPWRGEAAAAPGARFVGPLHHAIMNRRYLCQVWDAGDSRERIPGPRAGPGRWVRVDQIGDIPHSSLLDKAVDLWMSRRDRLRLDRRGRGRPPRRRAVTPLDREDRTGPKDDSRSSSVRRGQTPQGDPPPSGGEGRCGRASPASRRREPPLPAPAESKSGRCPGRDAAGPVRPRSKRPESR